MYCWMWQSTKVPKAPTKHKGQSLFPLVFLLHPARGWQLMAPRLW